MRLCRRARYVGLRRASVYHAYTTQTPKNLFIKSSKNLVKDIDNTVLLKLRIRNTLRKLKVRGTSNQSSQQLA